MKKDEVGICRKCGKSYDDYQQKHRRHICKECWAAYNYQNMKKATSTIDGYFKMLMRSIINEKTRNRHGVDINVEHLLKLWKLQDGKCAMSNIPMTWGIPEGEYKYDRKPFNVSIDRFDRSKGYLKDNVILVCNAVNMFKGCFDVSVVFDVSREILNNENRMNEVIELIHNKLLLR